LSQSKDDFLQGKRIVIAGARKGGEISTIIEKQGGTPLIRPLQGTIVLANEESENQLHQLIEADADWFIFTTGMGLDALLEQAGTLGIRERLIEMIQHAKVAARGYKTFAALKRIGITPDIVDEDGTVRSLIEALSPIDFTGLQVCLQLHGEPMPEWIAYLEQQGAAVHTLTPYLHIPPDTESVEQLCKEITESAVDAICFTTALQVRYLFQYVRSITDGPDLHAAFQKPIVAVAVGKVTEAALKEQGIERVITPENERMGAMIIELVRYYAEQGE
jgi:uroporphyrinogen-III synthase